MRAILFLLCCSAINTLAAEKPSDFAYGIAIQADGKDALYQLELPRALYRGTAGRELSDVRVFNGAGEIVPYAFRPRAASDAKKTAPVSLKLFPIYGETGKGLDGLSLRVERNAAGTVIKLDERRHEPSRQLLAYLVDASLMQTPVKAMEFNVKTDAAYTAKVKLEASDDLASWRVVVMDAPLVSLQHGGERLEQRRIEFSARKAKYFRISWAGMPQGAVLAGVNAESGDTRIDTARQWELLTGRAAADKPGEYAFDAEGHYPADRLRLEFPQPNTVAQFQLLSRNRAEDPWRSVARGLAYRLRSDGTELTSPQFAVGMNADRYWLLKIDQRGGGLGVGEPRLALGWLPNDIVFAARGEPPFMLVFGRSGAAHSAYAIESLVPGYRNDVEIGAKVAKIGAVSPTQAQPVEPDKPTVLGGERVLQAGIDSKKWTLWASLAVGVLFLGWMAWRLLNQMNASPASTQRGEDRNDGA